MLIFMLCLCFADYRPMPVASDVVTEVDMLELNHCYTSDGCHRFDQVILWEWSPDYRRYHVIGWWVVGNEPLSHTIDLEGSMRHNHRRYRGQVQRETWTIGWDPEVENRKLFPCESRRGL